MTPTPFSPFSGLPQPVVEAALVKTVVAFGVMFDFHRGLCKAGIHDPDSPFHPADCPAKQEPQSC